MRWVSLVAAGVCLLLSGTAVHAETVCTTWYGPHFNGRPTADGTIFHSTDPTIFANNTLAFGTRLKLTNLSNNHVLVGIVHDRGRLKPGCKLDVSESAAVALGFKEEGVTTVEMEVLDPTNDTTIQVPST